MSERARFLRRRSVVGAILVAVLITVVAARPVSTQSNSNSIIAAIENLQNAVAALQTSVNSLGAPNQGNVRFTQQLDTFSPDVEYCLVVNVSSVTHIVRAQLISYSGILKQDSGNVSLPAGQSFAGVASSENAYCKFSVVDGSRTDIRGSLNVYSLIGVPSDKLSLPAE